MTALKAHEVERYLKKPDLDAGVFLAYGPDGGLVREAAQKLARHYGGSDAGSMNVITLDGPETEADPGRLAIEAKTISLFGDRRVVRVRGAGKSLVLVLTELLDDPAGSVVILEGGNLLPRDPVRALVEASRRGRALPCYPDNDESLMRLINGWLAEAGIEADPDVAATLRDTLGNDREITRRELEKLGFFAAESKRLTRADVLTLCADNASLAIDAILDSAATGHAARLDEALDRALAAAVNPQQLVIMALGHFAMLRRWRQDVDAGRSVRDVLDGARPKPHFSRRASMEQQLRLWSDPALAAALERLQLASADSRKRYAMAETIVRRAFLAITTMAASH
ncbi:MAG TPA: DNA polymerase III subunit delta [Devosia sp.]|nr:DNA polymerase III subunit delta [Devosia sp.]